MKKYVILLFVTFTLKVGAQLNFTMSPTACKNETVNLVANSGAISSPVYTWSSIPTGINFSAPSGQTTNATFSSAANYTIFLTATSGTNTYSVQNTVTVNPSPTVTLAQSSFTTCITYNPTFSNPIVLTASGGQSYTWTPVPTAVGSNTNGPTNTFRPPATSCFTVSGDNLYGCRGSAIACVTVIPSYAISVTPSITVMCAAIFGLYTSVTLAAQPAINSGAIAPYQCEWSFTSSTQSVQPIIPTWTGTATYTVEMIDVRGCRSLPSTVTITADNCTSIHELSTGTTKLYPNPTNGKLTLVNSISVDFIEFTNSLGQLVFKLDKPDIEQEIDVSQFPPGIYFLKVENKNGQGIFKIIKE